MRVTPSHRQPETTVFQHRSDCASVVWACYVVKIRGVLGGDTRVYAVYQPLVFFLTAYT